ncbi:MAG: acetyltransferase [Gammaproteobacteria bacterium]|nr:acetyltransferase [Gammaproteobacteria bacterium]MDH5800393.1 acetyltransferase [Gammaproteobacteria bacterium]
MYMKDTQSGDLVEVLNFQELIDPTQANIHGRFHCGEEVQEPELFSKQQLSFPSNEPIPVCWVNPYYKMAAH